jgi:hypothetical protein
MKLVRLSSLVAVAVGATALAQSAATFTATGSMAVARRSHTATLLGNGKVLILGGASASGPGALATAEVYDPSTGRFSATGSMRVPRVLHAATLLPDGRVLITGGQFDAPAATAELYDPDTGAFTPTGQMSAPRFGHSATLLKSGKVLIAGGNPDSAYPATATAELYDPVDRGVQSDWEYDYASFRATCNPVGGWQSPDGSRLRRRRGYRC